MCIRDRVTTPWFEEQVPFSKAAEVGTEKVIKDHSVIGIVVTTDGSFGELQMCIRDSTRDRIYAETEWNSVPFALIDTGGIEPRSNDIILSQMRQQAQIAMDMADVLSLIHILS